MKKKPRINQVLRHCIQFVFLLLFPALFAISFSQIKLIYYMFILRDFKLTLNVPFLFEFILITILTILSGRFFCSYICAFGSLLEGWRFISHKLFKINFVINKNVDRKLKMLKYMLFGIILIMWTFNINNFNSFSPWDAIAEIPDFPNVIFMYNVGLVILLFILFVEIFIERFFCRYLCPLGAFLNIASASSLFRIVKRKDSIVKNEICPQNCTMGIDLKREVIKGNECIRCLKCIDNNTDTKLEPFILKNKLSKKSIFINLVTSVALIMIFKSIAYMKFDNSSIKEALKSAQISKIYLKNNYKSGTYIGIGDGFREEIEVKIQVLDNRITDIQVTKNNEFSSFKDVPFKLLPPTIIKRQSVDVDSISGATITSNGIKVAVEDALNQAQKN